MIWIWKSGVSFVCASSCCFYVNEITLGAHLSDEIIALCSNVFQIAEKALDFFFFCNNLINVHFILAEAWYLHLINYLCN